jgi:hypothetical protein
LAKAKPNPDAKHWIPVKNEKHDFIDSIRDGSQTFEDAEVGHRATSLCQLGLIAAEVEAKLTWDPAREQFTGSDAAAANERLKPYPARAPWDV